MLIAYIPVNTLKEGQMCHLENAMHKTFALIHALVITSLFAGHAFAQDAEKLVESIPLDVPQVLTTGIWNKDGKSGTYRTIVTSTRQDNGFSARVFLQWISIPQNTPNIELVKTVEITEVKDSNFSNAFVYIDSEGEDEITLIVTSYDPKTESEIQIWANASTPGTYKIIPPETMDKEEMSEKK